MPGKDLAGNKWSKAHDLGTLGGRSRVKDYVSGSDKQDFFTFTLGTRSSLSVSLKGLKANADLFLYDASHRKLGTSRRKGTKKESIQSVLEAGTYYLKVKSREPKETKYALISTSVSMPLPPPIPLTPPPQNPVTEYQSYSFTYYYGNGDFYEGYGYAANNTYSSGMWIYDDAANETGNYGYYDITDVTNNIFLVGSLDANDANKVVVSSYYDSETGVYYYPTDAFGVGGLGSESGYLDSTNTDSFFGNRYSEADVGNSGYQYYKFTYTYGSGDSYTGYGYGVLDQYQWGEYIYPGINETGLYGTYQITEVYNYSGTSTDIGRAFVSTYYDAESGAYYYPSASGDWGLSSESGYLTTHSDTLFSYYWEADTPNLSLITPNGGDTLTAGNGYGITWDDNISDYVKLELYKGSSLVSTIDASDPSDGYFSWTVPTTLTSGSDYRVKITSTSNSSLYDWSDNYFTIAPQPLPDLTIQNPSLSSSTITAGSSVSLSATVKNQGTATASASSLKYYLSNNATWDSSDIYLGSDSVGTLNVNASSSQSATFTLSTTGNKYILFVTDANSSIAESNESNNVAYKSINITAPRPDLRVQSASTPPSVTAGQTVSISSYTKNLGEATAGSSYTRYWLSNDATLDSSDRSLGSDSVGNLSVGGSEYHTHSFTYDASWGTGTKYILFEADGYKHVSESNESNNVAYKAITINAAKPDLKGSYFNVTQSSAKVGNSVTANFRISNADNGNAGSFNVGFYLSNNSTISTSDRLLGSYNVASLNGGTTTTTLSQSLLLPDFTDAFWGSTGTYYIGMRIDSQNAITESNESNNVNYGSGADYDSLAIDVSADLKKYWFYYNYNPNNYLLADSYIGSVIAPVGKYLVNEQYDINSSPTETGLNGQYLIYAVEDYDDTLTGEMGRVFVNDYIDRDNGKEIWIKPVIFNNNGGPYQPNGTNYLGSEVDYLYSSRLGIYKFGQDRYEADPDWFDINLNDAGLKTTTRSLFSNDSKISRNDMIDILANVTDGTGVDSTEFADLKSIINGASVLGMTGSNDYVRVLADKVVNGDTANQHYKGANLGNLAAGSSATRLNQLVDKWFKGGDRPTAYSYSGTTLYNYQDVSGSLFQSGIHYTDIAQGDVGDCYFVASLAAAALEKPSTISSMFIDNYDGTFTVRFYNNGVADYVTVDRYLPTTSSNKAAYAKWNSYSWFGGNQYNDPDNELWVALAEKAYAQLNESGWIGQDGSNSYQGISSGSAYSAMKHITGLDTALRSVQAMTKQELITLVSSNKMLTTSYAHNENVEIDGMHSNHVYTVHSYNSGTGKFYLYNPWGNEPAELTWEQMAALRVTFYWTTS